MPTKFADRKARTGAIVQSAIQGLSQFTQKLSQDRMKKQEEEAYGVANAILAAQESGNEAFMKAVTENASKGGVAKSLAKLLQAQQGGDLETVAKLSGTPVGKGLQRAITDRAAEADKQATKQADLRESAARAASAEAEPALKAAQAAREQVQATTGIPAQAEVDRATAALTNVQAGIVGKEVQQVGDKLAVVDKATNKMSIIGDAPIPPKVDMAAYSGIFPGIEKLGKIPSEAAQITLRAKFDELSEEDKQKFTAKEN
ncbi:MAG: hypothetical protein Q8P03_00900, partial [bacterium]|nr:hypothetical protein [bacterium]